VNKTTIFHCIVNNFTNCAPLAVNSSTMTSVLTSCERRSFYKLNYCHLSVVYYTSNPYSINVNGCHWNTCKLVFTGTRKRAFVWVLVLVSMWTRPYCVFVCILPGKAIREMT